MRKIGVGIAGMGFMARVHSRALLKIPRAKIAAVWSKFPAEHDRFRAFTQKLGVEVPNYYLDLDQMLRNPEVEAIICAVPWRFIHPIASRIIESGKPVLVECPPGASPAEIRDLEKAAKRAGAPVMPGHCYRFAPGFLKVKKLAEKAGGPVAVSFRELVPAASLARQWPKGSWVWDISRGGPVPTMTVFAADLARWISSSEASSVYSTLVWRPIPKLGTFGYSVSSILKFKNQVVWTLEFDGSVPESIGQFMNLEVRTKKGDVARATSPEHVELLTDSGSKEWDLKLERPERWGHKGQDEYFLTRVVARGEKPLVTLDDAEKAFRISLALMESARRGVPVRP